MLAAYTELKNAEKVKRFLVRKKILNLDYLPVRELKHLFFPMTKKVKVPGAKVVNTKIKFPQKEKLKTVEDLLKNKLTPKQLSLTPQSLEIVGKIMIIEIPESLEKKEKSIAEAYLKINKNVETVVKKSKIHSGIYRTRKVKILAGKKTKETIHFENGVKIKLHLEKTYFSARSGNERLRIAKQIKPNESVLVMFSGAAPFPLVFAKNSKLKEVYGIEINPFAHQYALENAKLNNLSHKIKVFPGDVKKILPRMRKKFDRIAMPLPKTGEEFLDVALPRLKKGGLIHLYAFLHEKEINKHALRVKAICGKLKRPVRILRKVKCGQFSPGTFRICFDMKIK